MTSRRPNKWLSLIVWLLPGSGLKNWTLRRLGNQIGKNVNLGVNLVLSCGPFTIGDGAVVGNLNLFRRMAKIDLAPNTILGNLNSFTAAADYQKFSPLVGHLIVGELAIITNRHYFDCSGQVILKRKSAVGGVRSVVQSHEMDLAAYETTVGRVVIGESAMTGSACVILRDATLPDRSVLAAGSTLTKAREGKDMPGNTLYAGAPAKAIRHIEDFAWWERTTYATPVTPFDDAQFRPE
jgi:acetyltransferase-like isoleucine patch superfamily enzyme